MTDTTEVTTEALAHRIATRGRDALVGRLRTAYGDAAVTHADIVTLSDERIEALVQSAADRADGLQWRRALAAVGSDELGVSLAEAHAHPAVARAHALVGAPSYEESLADLIPRPAPPESTPSGLDGTPSGLDGELETVQADDVVLELMPEPEPIELVPEPEPIALVPAPEPIELETHPYEDLHVRAIHLGGVASLPTKRDGLTLRLSENGLDIIGTEEIIGRLVWDEIDALEVPNLRVRRRRQQPQARLVVRTQHGDASFEIPGISPDELRDRVEPLVGRYGRQ